MAWQGDKCKACQIRRDPVNEGKGLGSDCDITAGRLYRSLKTWENGSAAAS